jgi:hypothetical protein
MAHTRANVRDSQTAIPLVDPSNRANVLWDVRANVPTRCAPIGRTTPKGTIRQPLRHPGIVPRIGRRGQEHGSGLGVIRWVVEEGAFAWLFQCRRLRVGYERCPDIHGAFLKAGCLLICWNKVVALC